MPKTKASLLVIAATAATVVTLFLLPFTPRTAVRTAVVERHVGNSVPVFSVILRKIRRKIFLRTPLTKSKMVVSWGQKRLALYS